MKLKVLGSGNIFSKYNSASYLIDDKILVDVPNGTCKILKNLGIESSSINNILITHFHGDHFFDMPFILLNKIVNNTECSNVYCDNTGIDKIHDATKLAFPNKVDKIDDYFKYISEDKFNIVEYEIEKVLLEHEEEVNAYGYMFHSGLQCIGFTGDSRLCENLEKMAEHCNHLICECNSVVGKKSHMGIDNLKDLAFKFPNCTFYTTHMHDETRNKLNELNIKNIVVLNDYDEFLF